MNSNISHQIDSNPGDLNSTAYIFLFDSLLFLLMSETQFGSFVIPSVVFIVN